jgi:predicted transposase/invertase (TIGR01784 family)
MEKATGKGKFIYMSVAQQLRQEGKQEGVKEVARNLLLKLGLDIDKVQAATGLTKNELEQLLSA